MSTKLNFFFSKKARGRIYRLKKIAKSYTSQYNKIILFGSLNYQYFLNTYETKGKYEWYQKITANFFRCENDLWFFLNHSLEIQIEVTVDLISLVMDLLQKSSINEIILVICWQLFINWSVAHEGSFSQLFLLLYISFL